MLMCDADICFKIFLETTLATMSNDKKANVSTNMKRKACERELVNLEVALIKLQGWIKDKGLKLAVIFEGRDSARKGGTIKRITRRLNPRVVLVVALPAPTKKEKTQWYI
jgi:polyphosphate kinase 2 (PPK2 family)